MRNFFGFMIHFRLTSNKNELSLSEKEQLIELPSDSGSKMQFHDLSFSGF